MASIDELMADLLRRSTKPVLLVVNKVDNAMREKDAIEFLQSWDSEKTIDLIYIYIHFL
jgi:predicted GTPase